MRPAFMIKTRLACLSVSILALSACGGGGGSSSTPVATPPPAPNMAPSFTSANTVDVSESVTGTAYSATASDADGNSLTYSISDRADAIHFNVDANSGDVLSLIHI